MVRIYLIDRDWYANSGHPSAELELQEKSREEAAEKSSAAKEEPERLRRPPGQSGRPGAKGFELKRACGLAPTDINEVMVSLYIMFLQLLTLFRLHICGV